MFPLEVSRMRVFLIFFYLAAVVGCNASVNKTQLASGVQNSDAAGTGAIKNEDDVDRLPPVITDPQKIKRLATGLAERGVPEDLIQDVIRELTSERVSRKKFASKITDPVTLANPSGSPAAVLVTGAPVFPSFSPQPPPDTLYGFSIPNPLPNGPDNNGLQLPLDPIENTHQPSPESSEQRTTWDFLSSSLQELLSAYGIVRGVFNALCT